MKFEPVSRLLLNELIIKEKGIVNNNNNKYTILFYKDYAQNNILYFYAVLHGLSVAVNFSEFLPRGSHCPAVNIPTGSPEHAIYIIM